MSKGVNLVILLGKLGADPEVRNVGQNNTPRARLSLATNKVWMDNGQRKEQTEWHKIVVWGKLATNLAKYIKKGSEIHVTGELSTRSWVDDQGQKRSITEVVAKDIQFVGSRPQNQSSQNSNNPSDSRKKSEDDDSFNNEEDSYDDLGPLFPEEPDFGGDDNESPF